jgi:hypothetical protein
MVKCVIVYSCIRVFGSFDFLPASNAMGGFWDTIFYLTRKWQDWIGLIPVNLARQAAKFFRKSALVTPPTPALPPMPRGKGVKSCDLGKYWLGLLAL